MSAPRLCSKRSWGVDLLHPQPVADLEPARSTRRPAWGPPPAASASEWAASVESTRVRLPAAAARAAVPAASRGLADRRPCR